MVHSWSAKLAPMVMSSESGSEAVSLRAGGVAAVSLASLVVLRESRVNGALAVGRAAAAPVAGAGPGRRYVLPSLVPLLRLLTVRMLGGKRRLRVSGSK